MGTSPVELEQGTQAWRDARCGHVTASRIQDVMRKPRKGQSESTTRKAYIAQIVAERLTGKPREEEFESYDTRRGTRLEPFARAEYELLTGLQVKTVGFIEHPSIKNAGCSPDALVGEDGLCQIKCPRTHVHLDYLMAGIVPVEYRQQMQFEMACTGRKWNDFVSHNEELPEHLQLFTCRLERNGAEIKRIEAEVVKFSAEVERVIASLPPAGKTVLEHKLEASIKVLEPEASVPQAVNPIVDSEVPF